MLKTLWKRLQARSSVIRCKVVVHHRESRALATGAKRNSRLSKYKLLLLGARDRTRTLSSAIQPSVVICEITSSKACIGLQEMHSDEPLCCRKPECFQRLAWEDGGARRSHHALRRGNARLSLETQDPDLLCF